MSDLPLQLLNLHWSPQWGDFSLGPVSANANAGNFVALVGPNGAGKSSLLKLVLGLNSPIEGKVRVFGRSPDRWTARERGQKMAYLSQKIETPFAFTVDEYVLLGRFPHLGPFRRPSGEDRRIVTREIHAWGLSGLDKRTINSLSGGEFQRARLAQSLAQEPGLLLLDEPGNHLDLPNRTKILRRLKHEASMGRCIIAVMHDINDALFYADTVWLLADGCVVDIGSPENVLNVERLKKVYGLEITTFRDSRNRIMLGTPSQENSNL